MRITRLPFHRYTVIGSIVTYASMIWFAIVIISAYTSEETTTMGSYASYSGPRTDTTRVCALTHQHS